MYEVAKEQAEENEAKKETVIAKPIRRKLNEDAVIGCKDVVKRQMLRSIKILERMVNQNNHHDISLGNLCSMLTVFTIAF